MSKSYSPADRSDQFWETGTRSTRHPLSLLLNWALVLSALLLWVVVAEGHFSEYKLERLFFNSVQDGLQPEDMDSAFMAEGVRRNLIYAGESDLSFMARQWLPHLPVYLLCFVMPFLVGAVNLRRPQNRQIKTAYVISWVLFGGYALFWLATSMELF